MEKHTPSLPVSPEDWDSTPPDIKHLVSSLLAKVALSESESYLIQFVDATPIGIAVHHATGELIYINNVGRSLLGTNRYSESETNRLSESFQIYRAGTQIPYPVEDLPSTRALAGETSQVSDLEIHRPDRIIPLEVTAIPVFDDQGQVAFTIATFQDISDRKQAELALEKGEQRFRKLFELTPKISVQGYSCQRQVIYWNDASAELYGYTKTEAIGRQLEDLIIPPEMRQGVIAAVQNWVINGQPIPADELNLMRKDGSRVAVYSSHIMLQNSEGEQEIYCVDIDLSDRKQAELALRESEERYRLLAENINDLVCLHDPDGRYLYVSPSCEALLGYRYDEMIGQDPYTFFHPDECDRIRQEAHQKVLSGKPTPVTYRMRQKSGNYIWFETLTKPIMDATGKVIQLQTTSRDVTERIQVQTKLKYDALHDTLTGLPNRNLLIERLELAIHRAKRLENYHFAVLFLDLDRFKVINDSLGHLAGDQLLIAIAHKLQITFSEIDLVARLGGDEFVVLIEEIKDIQEAIHDVERLFSELKIPIIF